MSSNPRDRGTTLVEVLVTVTLTSLVAILAATATTVVARSSRISVDTLDRAHEVSMLTSVLDRHARRADSVVIGDDVSTVEHETVTFRRDDRVIAALIVASSTSQRWLHLTEADGSGLPEGSEVMVRQLSAEPDAVSVVDGDNWLTVSIRFRDGRRSVMTVHRPGHRP